MRSSLTTNAQRQKTVRELESRIVSHGYSVTYQDICECAETPGFPGQIRGVTHHPSKRVRISRKANPTLDDMIDILAHELRHIEDPEWDCGNRDVLGRGGKK